MRSRGRRRTINPWRWVDPRIERVRVTDLQAYFLSRGWKPRPTPSPALLRFEKPTRRGKAAIYQMVPSSEQSIDFRQRVAELLTTLSKLEDRHPVAVLDDVLASGQASPDLNGANEPAQARVANRK
jgi:hypothetical protein